MGVGTLLSASLTRTALILAPAIGIATITQSILKNNALSFRQVLLASVLAGILTLIFALLRTNDGNSWRFEILRNIPDEIKLGIKGGVGALLSSVAVQNFQDLTVKGAPYEKATTPLLWISILSVALLFGCDLMLKYVDKRLSDKTRPSSSSIEMQRWVYRSATVITGLFMALVGSQLGDWNQQMARRRQCSGSYRLRFSARRRQSLATS
jgi:MFS superfamily sulfate permease-like transporter